MITEYPLGSIAKIEINFSLSFPVGNLVQLQMYKYNSSFIARASIHRSENNPLLGDKSRFRIFSPADPLQLVQSSNQQSMKLTP